MIRNALSVDVEEYFQVSAFEAQIAREDWGAWPSRVELATDRLLDLFARYDTSTTFFTLGWVAERYPRLIKRMVDEGHEVACHGYQHIRITEQTPAELREDIARSKDILENLTGQAVRGYRAASFSINRDNQWAFAEIEQAGFSYSSSVYPVRHDLYGIPDAPRTPYRPAGTETLVEIPVSTVRIGARNIPAGGGGYFRLFPYVLSRAMLRHVNKRDGQPANMYFHPWEFDPEQPRPPGLGAKTRLRHYLNQGRALARLERLLVDFSWSTFGNVYADEIATQGANLRVIESTSTDAQRWDAFVTAHAEGSFFHLFNWREVFEQALGHRAHYLLAEDEQGVCAVLPLVHVRSALFGQSLSTLPFTSFAGPLAQNDEAQRALEAAARELGTRLGVGAVEYRLRDPGGASRAVKSLYELFSKPIEADPDANMRAIRSKQRNVIRKGAKNGLVARIDTVENFYPVYAESVRNLGTPVFPRGLFSAIAEAFPSQVEILSACLDQRVISSSMNFYFGDWVCPYYWGGVYDARRLNGNDFLAFEIMTRAAARGAALFDFGRSKKDTGSYAWKVNLGFEPRPLYYEYELIRDREMPDINPLNPKYRFFVETWKKLPLPIANALGPWLSRSLG